MTHGIQPGERKTKESPAEKQGPNVTFSHPWQLRPLPADTGASSKEVLPITPRDLHWTESQRRKNKIHRKWPESNFQHGFPSSLWLYFRGENLTSLKLGGGVSKHAHWNSIKDLQISTSKDYLFAYLSCFSHLPLLESSWPMINLSEAYYYCGILV